MQFNPVFNEILILFLIIFVGYLLRKNNQISRELDKGLSNLLFKLTLPALIIISMNVTITTELIYNTKLIIITTISVYIFLLIIGNITTGLNIIPNNEKNIFVFMIIFGNVGYMGYPVLGAIYPDYGIYYALFNNITFNVLLWTYGVYLFTVNKGQKYKIQWKYLLNNGVIAMFIGFVLLLTDLQLPTIIIGALEQIGNMTFPLSMLIIGSSLAGINFKNFTGDFVLILLTIVKLLLIPIAVFLILNMFDLPSTVINITVILSAMPCAANSVVFAEKFERNQNFAARGVFITTFLSLFTIPLFLYLLGL